MSEIAKVKLIVDLDDIDATNRNLLNGKGVLDKRAIPLDPHINALTKLCFIIINSITSATSGINFASLDDCDDIHTWKPSAARFVFNKIYRAIKGDISKITDTQINPWCIRWSSCTNCTYGTRNGICTKQGSVVSNILSYSNFKYKQLVEIPEVLPSIIDFLDKNNKLVD